MTTPALELASLHLSTLAFKPASLLLLQGMGPPTQSYQQALTDQQKNAPVLAAMVNGPGVYAGFESAAKYLVPTARLAFRANLPRTPDIAVTSDGTNWKIALTVELIAPAGADPAAIPLLMNSYRVALVAGDQTPDFVFTTVTPANPPDGASAVIGLLKAEASIDETLALTLLGKKTGAQIHVTGNLSYQYSFTRIVRPPRPAPPPPPPPPHPGPGPHPLPHPLPQHLPFFPGPHRPPITLEADGLRLTAGDIPQLAAEFEPPHVETVTEGVTADQTLAALPGYFDPTLADYKPIYAQLTGTGSDGTVWSQETGHGYSRPAATADAFYILPDSFGLALDLNSGLPAMSILLIETPAASPAGETSYSLRVRLGIAPLLDGARLEQLREAFRARDTIPFPQLAVGGYTSATFVPSALFASLPGFQSGVDGQAGSTAIDAENGFELVLTCSLEFYTLLTKLLCSIDGLQGEVQFQLATSHTDATPPVATTLMVSVPVVLSFLGPVPIKLTPQVTAVPGDGTPPTALNLAVTNPLGVPLAINGIFPTLMKNDPDLGVVTGALLLTPSQTALALAPHETRTVTAAGPGGPLPAFTGLNVDFGSCTPTFDGNAVLDHYQDVVQTDGIVAAVHFNCYLLKHPDQLPASLATLIGMTVEVQHAAGVVLTVPLTRDAPALDVTVPYSFAELLAGVSLSQPTFQYRAKCVFTDHVGDFSAWLSNTGAIVEVVPV